MYLKLKQSACCSDPRRPTECHVVGVELVDEGVEMLEEIRQPVQESLCHWMQTTVGAGRGGGGRGHCYVYYSCATASMEMTTHSEVAFSW